MKTSNVIFVACLVVVLCLSVIGLLLTWDKSNNLLLGRVEGKIGGHKIVVTDCYRTSVPLPQKLEDGAYQFKPCRDADVVIRGEELTVNGRAFGSINPGDAVTVDHGLVLVNNIAVPWVAGK